MITDDEAREIAAAYHSPSPHDSEITKVSHGITPVDWELFVAQVHRNQMTLGGMSPTCREELDELTEWGRSKVPATRDWDAHTVDRKNQVEVWEYELRTWEIMQVALALGQYTETSTPMDGESVQEHANRMVQVSRLHQLLNDSEVTITHTT